jgi:hypothetical protein
MTLYKRCDCRRPATCDHPWWYKFKFSKRQYRASTRTANRSLAGKISHVVRDAVVANRVGELFGVSL